MGQIGQIINLRCGVIQPVAGLGGLFVIARDGQFGGLKFATRDGFVGFSAGSHAVGVRHMAVSAAAGIAGHLIGAGQIDQPRLQQNMGLGRSRGTRCHVFKIALDRGQAVQLLQSQRRRRWRIFGPGAKPVPAPQIALNADQALTG